MSDTSDTNASKGRTKAGPDMDAMSDMNTMNAQTAEAIQRISEAFTQALTKSVSTWAQQAQALERDPASATPNPDPLHVGREAAQVMSRITSDPEALVQAQSELWTGAMKIWSDAATKAATGQPAPGAMPPPGDRRWRDEDWTQNPMFDVIRQMYLLMSDWMVKLVEDVDGIDDAAKRKVVFFTKQMADAFAPTNFPMTNPAVLRATIAEKGENLVRGMRNLSQDLERGAGRIAISQTDFEQFSVGDNVATAPGDVVVENEVLQLIQYAPQTEQVYETPLLIFPPWINKFYILDLREENSMIRWLTGQGYQVFLASWVNPTPAHAHMTFEDYMRDGIFAALDATLEQTGQTCANTVGYCIGGTLLASTLALMGQTGDTRIASATFFAAQTDFSQAGDLSMFVDDDWMEEIRSRMEKAGGVLDGQTMADTFNMLRANDLVWSFMVNNYLLGKAPRAFDLLYWNADATRLPQALHLFYLDQFYRKNALSKGELLLGRRQVSLDDIAVPAYLQASRDDHIAPYTSVYKGAQKFGGETRFTLAGSGHIAGVINHPDAQKYQYWRNPTSPLPPTSQEWLDGAEEIAGSWWTDWDEWLAARSGASIAPTPATEGPLQPIERAPGSYVKAK